MKFTPLSIDEKRRIVGSRLKELLDRSEMKPAQLLHVCKTRFGINMASAQLSMIINGKRSLPEDYAHRFAEILDIDAGYLMGMDEYKAACYEDYPDQLKYNRNYHAALRSYNEYDLFLTLMGYQVEGYSTVDDQPQSYTIKRMDESKTISDIPAKEMESFRSDVLQYMNNQFSALFEKHEFLPLYNFNEKEIDSLVERLQNGTLTQGDRNMLLDTIKIGRENNNGK